MNDDDIRFVPNFKDAVQACVTRFPDAIFTFYNSAVYKAGYRFVRTFYMNGASCCIPTKYLPSFLEFYDQNLNGFRWDDTSVSIYALLNDIPVYLVMPKLIGTTSDALNSTLAFRKNHAQPENKGFMLDAVDPLKLLSAPISKSKRALKLHLPEDSDIARECKRRMSNG